MARRKTERRLWVALAVCPPVPCLRPRRVTFTGAQPTSPLKKTLADKPPVPPGFAKPPYGVCSATPAGERANGTVGSPKNMNFIP